MVAIAEPISRNTSELARNAANSQNSSTKVRAVRGQRQSEARPRAEHAEIAHDDSRRDRREHAGSMKVLGDEERAEGGDRGQRRLDEMIVGGSGDEHRREADDEPDQQPAAGDGDKGADDCERTARGRRIMRRPGEDQGEEHRRRAVVEQALGFDEKPAAARSPPIRAEARSPRSGRWRR